ncbi:hypothetical protein BSZ07_36315 [Streptomyces sp. M1013]|uniref:hypothetical protein n=1 Tax=Streptomyces sp. M1013 TaxID=549798 RepID=UPI000978D625|nr:hypothetical protein [Streptomyces sp. M1013]OMI84956.1 hypothetical protein BSZ07_36315 [Streptomyces sp. M1013]
METETQATLAAALAAGYALGRTKKGKAAIGVASVLAGQGLLSPKELISRALRKASASPQAAQLLEQVRGELMDSARAALSATADRRLGALAASLQKRTDALVGRPDDEDEESSAAEDEEAPEDSEPDEEEGGDAEAEGQEEEEESQVLPPRSRAKKSPAKRSGTRTAPAKKAPAGRKAPAKKAPAGKKAAVSKPTEKKGSDRKASTRGSRRR